VGEIVKDKTNGATSESDRDREYRERERENQPWGETGGAGMTFLGHPLELWTNCIVLLNGKIAANTP